MLVTLLLLLLLPLLLLLLLQATLIVSQVSHHNIRVIKFSPFEPDVLTTAGQDSIRTIRVKDNQLRAISVRLDVSERVLSPFWTIGEDCVMVWVGFMGQWVIVSWCGWGSWVGG
eukprot:GHUV01041649.1.p1 GENE.GHUV01041649.1~~GHUV01041649.1.p1  ORF type:complete len:114 (+),score=23.28 GHUV01041649.1:71-412(+)